MARHSSDGAAFVSNREHSISGEATDQQMDILAAVDELEAVLNASVPTTTINYAVEDLRRAISQYYRSPVIRTKDTPAPKVDTSDPFADQEGEVTYEDAYPIGEESGGALPHPDGNDDSGYHAGSLIRG